MQVVVHAGSLIRVPDSFKMFEAAGFMEATLTAYLNIFQIGGAEKGKSVLIHGGGSGVGRCKWFPEILFYMISAARRCTMRKAAVHVEAELLCDLGWMGSSAGGLNLFDWVLLH